MDQGALARRTLGVFAEMCTVCPMCQKGVCVQERKARDFRRQAEKENEGPQNGGGGAGGYRGPDGTGQWISMGELDPTEDLDQALGSLGGGTPSSSLHVGCIHNTAAQKKRRDGARLCRTLSSASHSLTCLIAHNVSTFRLPIRLLQGLMS